MKRFTLAALVLTLGLGGCATVPNARMQRLEDKLNSVTANLSVESGLMMYLKAKQVNFLVSNEVPEDFREHMEYNGRQFWNEALGFYDIYSNTLWMKTGYEPKTFFHEAMHAMIDDDRLMNITNRIYNPPYDGPTKKELLIAGSRSEEFATQYVGVIWRYATDMYIHAMMGRIDRSVIDDWHNIDKNSVEELDNFGIKYFGLEGAKALKKNAMLETVAEEFAKWAVGERIYLELEILFKQMRYKGERVGGVLMF
jgi:hypothetical protein